MDEATALLNLISAKLDLMLVRQAASRESEEAMSAEIDRIKNSVAQLTSVNQSAVALLGDLAARVRALQTDPAALTALADEIDRRKAELAQAVLSNTPAGSASTPTQGPGTSPTPPAGV
jgi:chromosome segregation ATPase